MIASKLGLHEMRKLPLYLFASPRAAQSSENDGSTTRQIRRGFYASHQQVRLHLYGASAHARETGDLREAECLSHTIRQLTPSGYPHQSRFARLLSLTPRGSSW